MTRVLGFLLLSACSGDDDTADAGALADGGMVVHDGGVDGGAACTEEGTRRCDRTSLERCVGGTWTREETCAAACEPTLGCVDCVPADRRTCIANNVRACTDEGLIGAVIEECSEERPCGDGYCGACAADTDLIYLLDGGAHLWSFDPRTLALRDIGAIDCETEASPYSMSVDRRGRAWVLFDSGEMFFVDIADASCSASGFTPDQRDFHTFGMGFVSESPGGAEILYIAGGPDLGTAESDTRLGTIDTTSLSVSEIAPLTVLGTYFPELSGDGAGGLYGYFPSTSFPSRVSTIRRETARIGPTWDAVRVEGKQQIGGWAFARWGGDFYVFVAITQGGVPPDGTEFYRLDPETGELRLVFYDRHTFVGAGVSTCAPLLI
jgi:hypothetical protein